MEIKEQGLFDHLKALSFDKTPLDDPKKYNAFMVNRYLSMEYDTALLANEMNQFRGLPKLFQYMFLLKTIPKKKRFFKYHKQDKDGDLQGDIKAVAKYFEVSTRKAESYLTMLSPAQIKEIHDHFSQTGGK